MSAKRGRPRSGWRGQTPFAPNTLDLFIEENVADKLPEFVATLEEYGERNGAAAAFVAQYWKLPKNKRRLGRVTLMCKEAGVSPVAVRQAFINAKVSYAKDVANYKRAVGLADLMDASLVAAEMPTNVEHLEKHLMATDLLLQPKGNQTTVQVANVSTPTALPSFEQMMADADRQIHGQQPPQLPPHVDGEVVEDGE